MLEHPIILWFYKIFNIDLPQFEKMEEYIDYILPKVGLKSHHISEIELYTNEYWLEIRDDDNAHEVILHMFLMEQAPEEIEAPGNGSEGADYHYSVDGNIIQGTWEFMLDGSMIINCMDFKMYSMIFLNEDFIILRERGNPAVHSKKYKMLARESRISKKFDWYDSFGRKGSANQLEWRDVMELFFNLYRFNLGYIIFIGIFVVLFFLVLLLSI